MAKRAADVDAEIDALFQLPLAEFTGARNALAGRLKKQGHGEEAERVKRIQKPPATAWAVNQLQRHHPTDMEALLEIGDRFRTAQAAQLAGKTTDLRGLLNERRDALSNLMKRATDILRDGGNAVSPDAARRITTTLEALATWGHTPGAPRAGTLTDDLDPPGFEALAALVPRPGGGKQSAEATRVLQFRQERPRRGKEKSAEDEAALRAKARDAVRDAEKSLREAQVEAERAQTTLKKAAAAAKAAETEKAEIEERYEKLQKEAQAASKEARRVAQEAEAAAQAVTEAEHALARARHALAEYDDGPS